MLGIGVEGEGHLRKVPEKSQFVVKTWQLVKFVADLPALHATERVAEELAEPLALVVAALQHLEREPVEVCGLEDLVRKLGTEVQNLGDADGDELSDERGRRLLLVNLRREEVGPVACHVPWRLRGRHRGKMMSFPLILSHFPRFLFRVF